MAGRGPASSSRCGRSPERGVTDGRLRRRREGRVAAHSEAHKTLAHEGAGPAKGLPKKHISGAKARIDFIALKYGLKPVPFTGRSSSAACKVLGHRGGRTELCETYPMLAKGSSSEGPCGVSSSEPDSVTNRSSSRRMPNSPGM